MTVHNRGRRQFLRGTGGLLMSIPFLGSIAPRSVRAQSARQKRFVFMATDHGGVHYENMFPDLGGLTTQQLFPAEAQVPAHRAGWKPIQLQSSSGMNVISNVVKGPSGVLTPSMAAKLNLIAGLDHPDYVAHQRSGVFGNWASDDEPELMIPTVDQVIGGYPGFNKAPAARPTINLSTSWGSGSSLHYAQSIERRNDQVVPVQATRSPRNIWSQLFEDSGESDSGRTPVIDHVYEHYRSLTRGAFGEARRLSAADRQRLEAHMSLLADVQRNQVVQIDCGSVADPGDVRGHLDRLREGADLIVAALQCGASNVAVITAACREITASTSGWSNWHEEVAHAGGGGGRGRSGFDPDLQRINYEAHSRFFQEVFLRVAQALDVPEDDEGTYLDRSLLVWCQESGDLTHTNIAMQAVTAGSADGYFETGRVVDYRNKDATAMITDGSPDYYPGLLHHQFLANILKSMDIPETVFGAEMQRVQPDAYADGARGYGIKAYHEHDFWRPVDLERDMWPASRFNAANDPLPFLVRSP